MPFWGVEIDRKGFGPKPKEIFGKRVSFGRNIGPKLAFRQPRQYLSGALDAMSFGRKPKERPFVRSLVKTHITDKNMEKLARSAIGLSQKVDASIFNLSS